MLEDSANPHDRLPMMAVAVPLAQQGQPVYHWEPAQPAKDQPGINIFRAAAGVIEPLFFPFCSSSCCNF